jgi:hypothetical protein
MNMNPTNNPPHRRRKEKAVVFPVKNLCWWIVLLVIGGTFVYRLSETGGKQCQAACLAAVTTSFLAAIIGLIPVYKVWGKDLLWVFLGVFISGVIRLLIALCGTGIIIFFTTLSRIQYVGFLAIYYIAFLAIDTWLALWVLNNVKNDHNDQDQEKVIHGNIWDIISRNRKPA